MEVKVVESVFSFLVIGDIRKYCLHEILDELERARI